MKAAVYTKTSSGKVLEIRNIEKPVPKSNEVLLRVRAASVNPLDWRMKKRRPGVDVAGEIEAVGSGVTQLKPGDAVFGLCPGAFAEYACAVETKLAAKPESVSFELAASVPVAALTALQALRDKGDLQPGQKVLINGAAGGVGTFSVQIAKWLGGNVTGVCSGKNADMVHSLGADRVIVYTKDDFIRENERYDLLLDNVGNRALSEMRGVLNPKGKCIMVGAPKQMGAVLIRLIEAFGRSICLRQNFIFLIAKINQKDLLTLSELLRTGKVTPVIDRRYPLSETGDAIAYVEEGHAPGKVVITME